MSLRPGSARAAQRLGTIERFHVLSILARARALEDAGRSIIHLEIGEPDFDTVAPIRDAGAQAIMRGDTHYTPALGLPALRSAISHFYAQRYAADVAADRIVITPGASGALLLALSLLVDPGDEVLLPDPGYPANRNFVRLLNGVPTGIPVGADSRYQLQAGHIGAHWSERTVAALVASPSNPTGTLLEHAEIKALNAAVNARGGALIVDEIYHGLTYAVQPSTAQSVGDDLIVVNSFSKYFGMTGWRLGWLVVPPRFVDAAERIAQNIFLAPPTAAQHAALAAFSPSTMALLDARRDEFRRRRDFLLPALRELGFRIPQVPEGAFYIYADCSDLATDSMAFARALLEEEGVAITPGVDFGSHQAAQHVRFAYTRPVAVLQEGVERMTRFLARYRR
jgi:aspartate/methionine/tyrosine aminotransferase